MGFGCFGPSGAGPSKKDLILDLERDRAHLEKDNASLRTQVDSLKGQLAALAKECEGHSTRQKAAEAALQLKSEHATRLLSKCTSIKNHYGDLVLSASAHAGGADDDGRASPRQVQVHAECDPNKTAAQEHVGPVDALAQLGDDDAAEKASLDEQLEAAVGKLEALQSQLAAKTEHISAELHKAQADRDALSHELDLERKNARAQEEQLQAQIQLHQLQCSAMEQENEQLTGMNTELQTRLDVMQQDITNWQRQQSSSQAQLAANALAMQTACSRALAAEAEARSLGLQLADLQARWDEANATIPELQAEVSTKSAALAAASSTLEAQARQCEELGVQLRAAQAAADSLKQQLETQTVQAQASLDKERVAVAALAATRLQLTTTQRELQSTQLQLQAKCTDLAAAQQQQQSCQEQLASTSEQLGQTLRELEAMQVTAVVAAGSQGDAQQKLIATSKQLAAMAKDHRQALTRLNALEAEAPQRDAALRDTQQQLAGLREQHTVVVASLQERSGALEDTMRELKATQHAKEHVEGELNRKIMQLSAIVHMAGKGTRTTVGSTQQHEQEDGEARELYEAVLQEPGIKLKVCEAALPLVGRLTAGIMDSSKLRQLNLDLDTSREVTWEKAALRISCLAAAAGLNKSLEVLSLGGWSWGELGNGTALPFLPLGASSGKLRSLRLASNLFDVEAAAMLKDLVMSGLVELQGQDGQGVLLLYSGNERLDAWYLEMISMGLQQQRLAGPGAQQPAASAGAGPGSLRPGAASAVGGSPARSIAGASAPSVSGTDSGTSSVAAASAAAPPSSGGAVDCDLAQEALESHHCVLIMAVLLLCPGLRRLRLDGNKIGCGGAEILALGLSNGAIVQQHRGGLRELNLGRNGIKAVGVRRLARALETNSTLLRLDLSGQRFEGLGAAGVEALAMALKLNRALEELNVASCGLRDKAAMPFASAIRAMASSASTDGSGGRAAGSMLRRLVLTGNGIDAATEAALKAAAADRPGLALVLS